MTDDIKLTLRKADSIDDWYLIERAQHDGRMWMEPMSGGRVMALRCSSRLSDADIEGTSTEMLAIADAIEKRQNVSFRRCAVTIIGERAEFRSPRNSSENGETSYACALELAKIIRETLCGPETAPEVA